MYLFSYVLQKILWNTYSDPLYKQKCKLLIPTHTHSPAFLTKICRIFSGVLSDSRELMCHVSTSQLVSASGSTAAHMFSGQCHGLYPTLGPTSAGVVS